ncbi:protein FAM13A [Erinaceus europaeus]|uniref:Protein FAM13A n=1 Tax=Erinaceus europaeus TaxID=9365 RepID=A0ABM3X6I1_ERIEU|nr:protein FAM13A [Erinaceus europaeus]
MGAGALAVCQSKAAVRLKADVKRAAAVPWGEQDGACTRLFGVSLQELQRRGLAEDGVPAVVRRLVEYLTQHGLGQEGLFRVSGSMKAVQRLRWTLERGATLEPGGDGEVSAAASLLKLFLRELPERLVPATLQPRLLQLLWGDSSGAQESSLRDLLRELPDAHYQLLKYLCQFLTQVAQRHGQNRMDIHNLATVFGPNCFHVSSGLEGMKEQELCNKIMAKILENYSTLFEGDDSENDNQRCETLTRLILVKEASHMKSLPMFLTKDIKRDIQKPSPKTKVSYVCSLGYISYRGRRTRALLWHMCSQGLNSESDRVAVSDPQSNVTFSLLLSHSAHVSQVGGVSTTEELLERTIRSAVEQHLFEVTSPGNQNPETLESGPSQASSTISARQRRRQAREQEESRQERDVGLINKENIPSGFNSLDDCILNAQEVERLHETSGYIGETEKPTRQKSGSKLSELSDSQERLVNVGTLASVPSQESPGPDDVELMSDKSKEANSSGDHTQHSEGKLQPHEEFPLDFPLSKIKQEAKSVPKGQKRPAGPQPSNRAALCRGGALLLQAASSLPPRRQSQQPGGSAARGNLPARALPAAGSPGPRADGCSPPRAAGAAPGSRAGLTRELRGGEGCGRKGGRCCGRAALPSPSSWPIVLSLQTPGMKIQEHPAMKIQEHPGIADAKLQKTPEAAEPPEGCAPPEAPPLELSALCADSGWEDPSPACSSWQQEQVDPAEAPRADLLIRQLRDEDSDPMLSPRFYAYGQSRQYLDDTEVPPSPPNSHSFMRRRSSSLGSYDDEQEDLTPAQLTRRIQSLKKKIRKFEDRFEEERKYRPSHSDKAANPEVLKWTNDLAKFRKQLKESKLKISEEDVTPMMRQRSNTLPKSFGSQLEKEEEKKQELVDKALGPSVEATLESIQRKLQEKRTEASRPEDIKDMTKDQIANEKVALQKALLYYESIHGRPVTKNERQVMKPLYDRYRLVKQILSRANAIPIIGSPSTKRRSPLLQPIIEGETASFFKEIKEEDQGSEDDSSTKPDLTVTLKTDFTARCFLDQFEDDTDGFISPMDDKMPSKGSQDTGLSNLHAASIPELLEHLQEMREEKKRIRKKLRDFEDSFFRQHGRNVQKEERTPMAEEYTEYKHIKAKLRLLEVLISKRDADSKAM